MIATFVALTLLIAGVLIILIADWKERAEIERLKDELRGKGLM